MSVSIEGRIRGQRVNRMKETTVQRSQYMAPRPQLLPPMKEI